MRVLRDSAICECEAMTSIRFMSEGGCRRLDGIGGQVDLHGGSPAFRALNGNGATVEVDDFLADGQTEAEAAGLITEVFGGEIRSENPGEVFRGNTGPLIDDLDAHPAGLAGSAGKLD